MLASRTQSKLENVAETVRKQSPGVAVHQIVLDLGDQDAIRKAVVEISKLIDRIDILINNAGFVSSSREETAQGIEKTFGINHIGHWLFTSLLSPLLDRASSSAPAGMTRVINVTSMGHKFSPVRFDDYNFLGNPIPPEEEPPAYVPPHMKPDVSQGRLYQGFTAYAQSKTANILHCLSLNRRLNKARAFAAHPGSMSSRSPLFRLTIC